MTVTRDDFNPAVPLTLPLKHGELHPEQDPDGQGRRDLTAEDLAVVTPAPQELPRRDRIVTYPTPDGPTRLGTVPTAPYGEDPHDPTTHAEPRRSSTGMVGRLHL